MHHHNELMERNKLLILVNRNFSSVGFLLIIGFMIRVPLF